MKKIAKILIVAMIMVSTMSVSNFNLFATSFDNGLTDVENAAFITREEFELWRESFIASLSELDAKSTQKIYDNMDFYDMQFKFTETYKVDPYVNEITGENTELLDEMIADGKAKRGLL